MKIPLMRRLLVAILIAVYASANPALAQQRIVVSVPGPRNISYLPIDLIPAIGADREEGVGLQILHVGGGGVALNNLVTRNADFAVAGFPAAMSLKSNGGDVVGIAAVNDAPLFVLMVRSGLKGEVRRIADLKGKTIGVNTSTKNSKTTSQQLAEIVLKSDGVRLDMVRIVPAGQSWVEQSSLLITGAADAVMGDEPFASRLAAEKQVFFLAHLGEPETAKRIPGADFLHAALEARGETIVNEPEKVGKMVRMLVRSLQWIARHSPEALVDRLKIEDADERDALLRALKQYPRTFSKDGRFSTDQLKSTEQFFHATNADNPRALAVKIESIINDRWVGRTN